MQNFIRYFIRVGPGVFTCVRDGEFCGPSGRIQVTVGTTFTRGSTFMGLDLASALEEEYQKKNGYASPADPQDSHPGFSQQSPS